MTVNITDDELIEARHQALMSLTQCAQYIRERDALIRRAVLLGISRAEIARILGLTRSYVTAIASKGHV